MLRRLVLPLAFIVLGAAQQLMCGAVEAATIAGVTIENFSSELETSFNRGAIHAVDGSGLTGNQHTNVPDNFMWLNSP